MKRVLIDECLPMQLHRLIDRHEARTVRYMGWLGVKNGRLLDLAQQDFDVFLTADQGIAYQQQVIGRSLAVVILPVLRLRDIRPLLDRLQATIDAARPGQVMIVTASD